MMDSEVDISEVCFQLTSPRVLQGNWDQNWFDSAHYHSLLLKENFFYLLSYPNPRADTEDLSVSDDFCPHQFYHFQETIQTAILFAKVSLDSEVLAVQTSDTTIVVIDIVKNKKWLIEIRFPNDNLILPFGIIWSDHCGNSQDLIIVTSKGLELYKVSTSRGHCKLSRVVYQSVFHFWYEPNHRMILLASQQPQLQTPIENLLYFAKIIPNSVGIKQFLPNSNGKKENSALYMDGYFLKFDKSLLPMLELPLPDKAPRFEVGPNVSWKDISVVSLYGKIFCLVKYTNENLDYIGIYLISKTSIEKIHSLSLNCTADSLQYSLCDNLLICHSSSLQASIVFDIMCQPKKCRLDHMGSESIMSPIQPLPYPLYFVDTLDKNCLYIRNQFEIPLENDFNNSAKTIKLPTAIESELYRSDVSEVDFILDSHRQSTYEVNQFVSTASYSKTVHAFDKPIHSTTTSTNLPIPLPLKKALIASEVYFPDIYEFLGESLVWDSNRKVMWSLKVNSKALLRNTANQRECTSFLMRRGQTYIVVKAESADGVLDYSTETDEGRSAKQVAISTHFLFLILAVTLLILGFVRSLGEHHSTS